MKEKIQRSLWPDLLKGFALFAISLPFTVVAILKLVYNLPNTNSFLVSLSNSIVPLYENYAFIKFMWPISPSPSVESVFTFGNFMGLAVLACSVVGFGWMSRANYNHSRLLEAKRKAQEQQLIDDYKK
ncbi:hypothetical protein SanaruYs_39370 [Chryseotalea sanaruensis]|uniref:Uncharacterized protein n=1 Tax=Chryseotalea sanaruensis TaxID=2482724 RepID=A0A401UFP4_9BACT|nr:hypothetical protein [Chryseotalea sanaruensis]GCC53692.1 hypothetical protein SanaruYs_39370 [Chryseotalea sanaruensis]